MNQNRLFAVEEGYVSIFEEYSFFWNAPVLKGSRAVNPATGQWEIVYDLSGRTNLKVVANADPGGNLTLSRIFPSRWTDIYMSDLKWDKTPITVDHIPAGFSGDFQDTIGHTGKLSFSAAHFNDALWRMTGFRKSWRVFVDFKRDASAPIERSWEFRGCTVSSNDYGGSPLSLSRTFKVREIPEVDGIHSLSPDIRGHMSFVRSAVPAPSINIIDIDTTTTLVGGSYHLEISKNNLVYDFTYNGITTSVAWLLNKQVVIPGGIAGNLTIIMKTVTGPISVEAEDILVVQ